MSNLLKTTHLEISNYKDQGFTDQWNNLTTKESNKMECQSTKQRMQCHRHSNKDPLPSLFTV